MICLLDSRRFEGCPGSLGYKHLNLYYRYIQYQPFDYIAYIVSKEDRCIIKYSCCVRKDETK